MKQMLIDKEEYKSDVTEKVTFEKPYVVNISRLPNKVDSKIRISEQYLVSMLIIGVSLMGIFLITEYLFNFDFVFTSIFGTGVLLFFIGVLFFLLQPKRIITIERTIVRDVAYPRLREITKPIIVYVDKPVTVEKIVEKPVVKEIIKFVERPVIQYVPQHRLRLNLPRYKYVGSTETRRYHKKSCRFSKLIKKKYKINSNSIRIFKRKRFKNCKICLKNISKI